MLLYFISRIISSTGAFLYPTYASYKTLSRRPSSEADLERWLMYWAVLGTIVGLEYVAEWSISWIPFYHPLKTLFLLYLALPQTRGASYVYTKHLHPLLAAHEAEIDLTLVRVKDALWRWIQQRIRVAWVQITNLVAQEGGGVSGESAGMPQSTATMSSSSMPSGPAQLAQTLWRAYGPAILASGTALFQSTSTSASKAPTLSQFHGSAPIPAQLFSSSPQDAPRSMSTPSPLISQLASLQARQQQDASGTTSAIDLRHRSQHDLLARRRALEAELAALPLPNPDDERSPGGREQPNDPVPLPLTDPQHVPSSTSSTYLPIASSDDRGRYEEIGRDEIDSSEDGSSGVEYGAKVAGKTLTSWWWGWGGAQAGYERIKTD